MTVTNGAAGVAPPPKHRASTQPCRGSSSAVRDSDCPAVTVFTRRLLLVVPDTILPPSAQRKRGHGVVYTLRDHFPCYVLLPVVLLSADGVLAKPTFPPLPRVVTILGSCQPGASQGNERERPLGRRPNTSRHILAASVQ